MVKRIPCFLFMEQKNSLPCSVDPILSHLKHTDSVEKISCTLKTTIMAILLYNFTGICTIWNYTWKWKGESNFARTFIAVFTRTCNGNIPRARLIQLKSSLSLLRFILVLSSHVCFDLASGRFPWGFHPNILHAILSFKYEFNFLPMTSSWSSWTDALIMLIIIRLSKLVSSYKGLHSTMFPERATCAYATTSLSSQDNILVNI
jgi:hypothetical protein